MNTISEELKIAIETAKEAGSILLQYYNEKLIISTKENDTSVTNADFASNDFIIKNLQNHFTYPILSEESADNEERLNSDKVWIIDPLDGTRDFIKKTGEFTVAIALVQNNEPIIGVVYRPTTNETYYAQKGTGAFMQTVNGVEKILVSKTTQVSDANFLITTSDSEYINDMEAAGILNKTRMGSAALKICKVAQGEYDTYFVLKAKTSEWDDCAPGIILAEAGGLLSDVFGESLLYNQKNASRTKGLLATNRVLHKNVVEKIYPIALKKHSI